VGDAAAADVLAELRERLDAWMRETRDALLDGAVPAPPGAEINLPDQRSPSDPTFAVGPDGALAPSARSHSP